MPETIKHTITFTPVGPMKRVSSAMVEFDAVSDGLTRRISFYYPTRDRRIARRIARVFGLKFRRGAEGTFHFWKSKPDPPRSTAGFIEPGPITISGTWDTPEPLAWRA